MKQRCLLFLCLFASVNLQLSAQFSASVETSNAICGANNGTAQVIASGGSNYTYKWSTGSTSADVSGLAAGTYTVTVYSTSGGGSTTWDSIYYESFDSAVQTWTINIPTGANGVTNNYWDISDSCIGNGAIGACVDNTFSPAPGSNKCLYITNQPVTGSLSSLIPSYPGCRFDAGGPGFCSLGVCPQTNMAAQSPNISTVGTHNLVLSYQYTAGGAGTTDCASLLYSINGGASFTTLASPVRSVNSAGCDADGDEEGTWAYSTYVLPATCVNISDLVIRFNWTNNNSDASATDPSIAVDNVTIRDSVPGSGGPVDSIVKTVTITAITPPSVITGSATLTQATCGQSNGAISGVTVSGGTNPITYKWTNSSNATVGTTLNVSGLPSGSYTILVTDSNNCTATASVSVSSAGGPVIHAAGLVITSTTCGNSNGSATGITASGGSGSLSYRWINSSGDTVTHTNSLNNAAAGTYTFLVTDASGCSTDTTITIGAITPPSISLGSVVITKAGCAQSNGAISGIIVNGGTNPISYKWTNGSNTTVGTTAAVGGLPAGLYTLLVTDSNNCTTNASVNVSSAGGPAFVTTGLSITNATCGGNNGSITGLSTSGGIAPVNYKWVNSSSTTVSNTSSLTQAGAGTYTVTATDSAGCSSDTSFTLTGTPAATVPTISTPHDSICSGDSTTICPTPQTYNSYAWSDGEATACITTPYGGNYYVTVTDNNGCTAVSNGVNIGTYSPLPVTVSQSGDTLTSYPASSYQWYRNDSAITGATSATYVATLPGTYYVVVTDSHGCTAQSSPATIAGIGHVNNDITFSIYPNPVNGNLLQITTGTSANGKVLEVYDEQGRLIVSDKIRSESTEINLANWAAGVYLVKIAGSVQKLVKE